MLVEFFKTFVVVCCKVECSDLQSIQNDIESSAKGCSVSREDGIESSSKRRV